MDEEWISFPPPPRSWDGLIASVLATMAAADHNIGWSIVRLPGMSSPWVGVQALDVVAPRPWTWDIVTPSDYQRMVELRSDPLVVPVAQDTVVVDVTRADFPGIVARLQVPVTDVPMRIDVDGRAMPPPPWQLELHTGWSAQTICTAIGAWLESEVGSGVGLVRNPLHEPTCSEPDRPRAEDAGVAESGVEESGTDERHHLGDGMYITSSAFERLLALDIEDAAHVTGALAAVAEALIPYRIS
jgi:hypothetical protein